MLPFPTPDGPAITKRPPRRAANGLLGELLEQQLALLATEPTHAAAR